MNKLYRVEVMLDKTVDNTPRWRAYYTVNNSIENAWVQVREYIAKNVSNKVCDATVSVRIAQVDNFINTFGSER